MAEDRKFDVTLVPKHYDVSASLDADDMLELIMSLRRFVDEFDAPETTEQLLVALEGAYVGELPQRISAEMLPEFPGDEDDDDEGEEAYV